MGAATMTVTRLSDLPAKQSFTESDEAVARLPDAFIEDCPDLRLKAFKGMRNIVAHRYHDVDYEILWQTVAVDIPRLAGQITGILGRG